ncbi:calcium-binding protein [Nocardioides sp. GCM10027113]|uniref:calcium-binding protein n=1 Tax=unclassified Nocardioides TaxID=2615069 RepID=UPI00360883A1
MAAGAAVLISAGLAPAPASAALPPDVEITFTGEATGAKPNGYSSAEAPNVQFFDTVGADLQVDDFGVQSNGLGLLAVGDDASAIEIRLPNPTTGISLAFGNDDPGFSDKTDQAQLKVFRGADLVGTRTMTINSNDEMDQRIGISGTDLFNRAIFQYVDAAGAPNILWELVDDIRIEPICTVLGTPGNDLLLGTADSDVICGDDGNDRIRAFGGDDLIFPGDGNDRTRAGGGADFVQDARGADLIKGGAGPDDVRGAGGPDDVYGNGARDRLFGGPGPDFLNGGAARDRCDGGVGKDQQKKCERKRRIP